MHAPPTEAELKDYNAILKSPLKSTASASQKLSEKLSYASSENPIAAKYVSPKTGQVINADIVGLKDAHGALDANGEINHAARVLVRTTGEDGRTVTREIALKDLAFGHDQKAIGAQGGARSIDHAVDRLVEKAMSSNERIGELERQSATAARAGDLKPGGAWDKAETEKAQLLKLDQPLTHDEVRHIEAVHEAFTKENIAKRMPLDISKTGDITIRASGSMNRIAFTNAELKDIRHVKSIAEARNHSPRAIEDVQHFEKIKNLDEKKIVTDRIDTQRSAAVRRMNRFVQGAKCCAFPQNLGIEFQPSQLAKAYGARSSSAVESITKVQKLLKKDQLTSMETWEVQDNLRSLRSASMPASAASDVNLNSFLDFAADRVGYERLNELSAAYRYDH